MAEREEKNMRKKKNGKLTASLLALTLALTVGGCGSSGEQETSAETAETETNASDTIGSGADMKTEADTPEADDDASSAEETQAKDFQFIDQWITAIGESNTEMTLIIAPHLEESKTVTFSYENVLLDGVPAENWDASGIGTDTFTTEQGVSFPQTLILNTNIDNYSELTIEAAANFDDGTEPYPFSVTYQVSELKRDIEESPAAPSLIHIKEQELYNENGIVITLPEQKLDPSKEPQIHFENNTETTIYLSYMNLTVDDELIQEGAHNTADGGGNAGVLADEEIPVGESLQTAVDSGRDSGEITFVLFITDNQRDPIAEPEITIPYTLIRE